MSAAALLVGALAACSAAGAETPAESLPAALDLLGRSDPLLREEGATRLSILGGVLPRALEGRPAALACAEADTASMAARIEEALELRDPQRMLWRACHALRGGCLAREWAPVSEALARQSFRFTEIYEPDERSRYVRFLARSGAYVNSAGDRHDLFFWIHARKPDGLPWRVHEVYVGLNVRFDAAWKALSASDRYPRRSVLGAFFELPEIQKLAASFPVLEEIDFTYGRIRDPESDLRAWGFQVNASFLMEGKRGGRSVHYSSEAHLDPLEGPAGSRRWPGFAASDALGPLTARGRGFWGSASPPSGDD